ncbi:MAG TPA: hypothetical protein VF792_00210 [Ktedonobacterales bacterium]
MTTQGEARLAHLRTRLAGRFALRDLTLDFAGTDKPFVATIPADPDAPLDEMAAAQAARGANSAETPESEQWKAHNDSAAAAARATIEAGAHLPYWALLWPSGLALAEALLAEPATIQQRRCLELGCGLGVTAAVALSLGADLTISDLFPEALLFAEYNTLRMAGQAAHPLLLNWRTPAGRERLLATAPFDMLLAADVLYEPEDLEPLLTLAPALLRPDAPFWLAEPGRKASRAFVEQALARGWTDTPSVIEHTWPPDGDLTRVTIHRFCLP